MCQSYATFDFYPNLGNCNRKMNRLKGHILSQQFPANKNSRGSVYCHKQDQQCFWLAWKSSEWPEFSLLHDSILCQAWKTMTWSTDHEWANKFTNNHSTLIKRKRGDVWQFFSQIVFKIKRNYFINKKNY